MKKYSLLLAVLAVILALGMPTLFNPTQAEAAQKGLIRFIHVSPGLIAVDVYLNDAKDPAFTGLEFGKATAFVEAVSGKLNVAVRSAGDNGAPLFSGSVTVGADETAQIALIGKRTLTGAAGLRLSKYPVNAAATNGQARVYFINAALDLPILDVRNGDAIVARSLTYARGSAALELKPGLYTFQVMPTGKVGPALVTLGNTEIKANTIYTVLISTLSGQASASAVVLTTLALQPVAKPEGTMSFLRITHASPDAPAVDIYLDNARQPVVKALEFGKSTEFMELAAKTYTVTIRAAKSAATSKPIYERQITLTAGLSAEVVALGSTKGDPAFSLAVFPIQRSVTAGKARVYIIQAAPKAGTVDWRLDGKVVASALEFSQYTTTALEVDPGLHNVVATPAGKLTPAFISLIQSDLAADTIYSVVALPDVPEGNLLAQHVPLLLTSPQISEAAEGKTGLVRLSHVSVSLGNIDVYFDGASTPTVKDLAFGASSDYLKLPAKVYKVAIRPAGTSALNAPAVETTLTVKSGLTAEVVAMGLLGGSPEFALNTFPVNHGAAFGKARIYILHAATKASPLDLHVNGKYVLTGQYGDFTEPPLEMEPGMYNFAVTPEGKPAPVVVRAIQFVLAANTVYFGVVLDDPNGQLPAQDAPLVLTTALPGTVRLVHALAGGPDVDVYLDGAKTPTITKLAFNAASNLIELAPKDYAVTVREAGAAANSKPLYETTLTVKPGVTADVVMTGISMGGRFLISAIVTPIDRGLTKDQARLYVIHAAPRGGKLDLRVNGKVAQASLAFGYASAPIDIAPGLVNIVLTPNGKPGPVIARLTQTELAANTIYTVIVPDDPAGQLIAQDVPLVLTSPEVK